MIITVIIKIDTLSLATHFEFQYNLVIIFMYSDDTVGCTQADAGFWSKVQGGKKRGQAEIHRALSSRD